ncbi:MAG: acyltransferase [Bacteroidetes bacterium]|nr:acyltransferase [Bacteroidota bacterium]
MSKKVYFENLDGLRFLCFLSVFFFHSFHTEYDFIKDNPVYTFIKKDLFGNGNLGVNFFFVLSGFLITFLLIEEKKLNRQIDLRNFWIRRILRIWPLFYFCVFFGFVMFPMIKEFFGQVPNETASPLMYLTFLNNFDIIRSGLPDSSVLGVLWSVAIEEQFYLLWPVILFALPVRNYWMAFAAIIVSSLFYRAMNDSPLLHEHHTLSCIGDMAIGAFGAWMISESKKFKELFENLKKYQIAIIYILFGLVFLFRDEVMFSSFPLRIFDRSITALIMLSIILEQNYAKNSLFKMSDFKRISKLGTITYGLYCLHFIGILVATTITKN